MIVVFHDTVGDLQVLLKKENNVKIATRIKIVVFAMLGESLDEIIYTLETSRTHVKKWVRRYNEGNCDFKDLPRSGRPQKIDEKKKKK